MFSQPSSMRRPMTMRATCSREGSSSVSRIINCTSVALASLPEFWAVGILLSCSLDVFVRSGHHSRGGVAQWQSRGLISL